MSKPDYHAVLNISKTASMAEIVQAYRTAISAYEPDSLAAYSLFDEAELERLRQETEEAYQALCQSDKRHACDAPPTPE